MKRRAWLVVGGVVALAVASVGLWLGWIKPEMASRAAALEIPAGQVAMPFPIESLSQMRIGVVGNIITFNLITLAECQAEVQELRDQHPEWHVVGYVFEWQAPPNDIDNPPPDLVGTCYWMNSDDMEIAERQKQEWRARGAPTEELDGYYGSLPESDE